MAVSEFGPAPDAGFEYPYYLYVPAEYSGDRPILVESTNSGKPSDDFDYHCTVAEERVNSGIGRRIADKLGVPYLHPVFPRPVGDPVDWTHSIHQLCAQTMQIEEGPLYRVDLQLLAMVEDARERLSSRDWEIPERFMLNGFSASGTFANRFSILHPNRVLSVSAGGVNGMVTLPLASGESEADLEFAKRFPLNFPVGIANLEGLTGDPFDGTAFREVRQFIYMGENDDNDTLLWPDAWTDPELRAVAILTYGPDIHEDRFPYCASVYAEQEAMAIFRTYPETGHDPTPAIDDIVTFHELSLAGVSPEELDDAIEGNPV